MKILQKWNIWSLNTTKSFNIILRERDANFQKKESCNFKKYRKKWQTRNEKVFAGKTTNIEGTIKFSLQLEYGEDMWLQLLERADCKHMVFNTRQTYPDELMTNLAAALAEFNGESVENVMQFFGKCFVRFFSNLG